MVDNMFKKLFKKNKKITEDETKHSIPIQCFHNADNKHCNLILELQKQQSLKNEIEKEIETLNNRSLEPIQYFAIFLNKLEENGLCMGRYDKKLNQYLNEGYFIGIFKRAISECSFADICRIAEELKAYKNKDDVICKKYRDLKAIQNTIEDIKIKLGIE